MHSKKILFSSETSGRSKTVANVCNPYGARMGEIFLKTLRGISVSNHPKLDLLGGGGKMGVLP